MSSDSQMQTNNTRLSLAAMPHKISRILCPTDLSPASDEALRYAVALAKSFSAKLLICHSVEDNYENIPRSISAHDYINRIFAESLGAYVSDADQPQLDWQGIVLTGDPASMIIDTATNFQVDLIVMRSRRRPLGATLLGSTAEKVCHSAPCPVLVTHPAEQEWVDTTASNIDLKRVLVAYDFSEYSELALEYGLALAAQYHAELHLLHILPTALQHTWYALDEKEFNRVANRLQYVISEDAQQSCEIKHAVREGSPYREILDYASDHNIDLICLGAHGTGFSRYSIFGSNVDRVLRQAKCPIFIAHPLKSSTTQSDINNQNAAHTSVK